MEARAAALEGAYKQVADRLNSIDARLNTVDQRFDRLDARLDALGPRIDALGSRTDALGAELRARMDGQFKWLLRILVTCGVAATGAWITTMLTVLFHVQRMH